MATPSMKNHLVVALAYDRLCTFEFGCVVELFALHRPELGVPWYRFAVCSAERRPLRAAGGIKVSAPYSLKILERADTICCANCVRRMNAVRDSARSAQAYSFSLPPEFWMGKQSRRIGGMRSGWRSAIPPSPSSPTPCTSMPAR